MISDNEIDSMSDRDLVHLIWDSFGVIVDYSTSREDVLKILRRLAS